MNESRFYAALAWAHAVWWLFVAGVGVLVTLLVLSLVGGCSDTRAIELDASAVDDAAELELDAGAVDAAELELDAAAVDARAPIPIGPRDLGDLGPCVGVNPEPFDACWLAALDAGWDPCPRHCACSLELDGGIACDGGAP